MVIGFKRDTHYQLRRYPSHEGGYDFYNTVFCADEVNYSRELQSAAFFTDRMEVIDIKGAATLKVYG